MIKMANLKSGELWPECNQDAPSIFNFSNFVAEAVEIAEYGFFAL
jgi:hypothetical protein